EPARLRPHCDCRSGTEVVGFRLVARHPEPAPVPRTGHPTRSGATATVAEHPTAGPPEPGEPSMAKVLYPRGPRRRRCPTPAVHDHDDEARARRDLGRAALGPL